MGEALPRDTELRQVQLERQDAAEGFGFALAGSRVEASLLPAGSDPDYAPIFVSRVISGSAAEAAGLCSADRVVGVNGRTPPADLNDTLALLKGRCAVELLVVADHDGFAIFQSLAAP